MGPSTLLAAVWPWKPAAWIFCCGSIIDWWPQLLSIWIHSHIPAEAMLPTVLPSTWLSVAEAFLWWFWHEDLPLLSLSTLHPHPRTHQSSWLTLSWNYAAVWDFSCLTFLPPSSQVPHLPYGPKALCALCSSFLSFTGISPNTSRVCLILSSHLLPGRPKPTELLTPKSVSIYGSALTIRLVFVTSNWTNSTGILQWVIPAYFLTVIRNPSAEYFAHTVIRAICKNKHVVM